MPQQSSNLAAARALRDSYDSDELQQAFADGYDAAHGIACHIRPKVGDRLFLESEGRVTVDQGNLRDVWVHACFETEQHARCFSPWEQIASRINASGDPESLWDAYEAGVSAAIEHDTTN